MSVYDIIVLVQIGALKIVRATKDRRVLEMKLTGLGERMLANHRISL